MSVIGGRGQHGCTSKAVPEGGVFIQESDVGGQLKLKEINAKEQHSRRCLRASVYSSENWALKGGMIIHERLSGKAVLDGAVVVLKKDWRVAWSSNKAAQELPVVFWKDGNGGAEVIWKGNSGE
ncbi:hypothetical protein E2C01_010811 [Portunus trituberculatus]|uniref:Uncharacterized protein n=1 Tax=Portunus trituberculatus TaxID=210409 RepID=A0A5B7D9E9_PORTR|nr:hypothetical protein [Portunus trituberculatus]